MFNRHLKQRIADLENQLKNDREVIGYLKEANKRRTKAEENLQSKLELAEGMLKVREKQESPLKAERLVGIKFRALFNGFYQPTEFKTGPGTCGKNVKWFTVEDRERDLTIRQHHTDGSRKDFVYRKSDIDGRMQYDFEFIELTGKDAEDERARTVISRRLRFA